MREASDNNGRVAAKRTVSRVAQRPGRRSLCSSLRLRIPAEVQLGKFRPKLAQVPELDTTRVGQDGEEISCGVRGEIQNRFGIGRSEIAERDSIGGVDEANEGGRLGIGGEPSVFAPDKVACDSRVQLGVHAPLSAGGLRR